MFPSQDFEALINTEISRKSSSTTNTDFEFDFIHLATILDVPYIEKDLANKSDDKETIICFQDGLLDNTDRSTFTTIDYTSNDYLNVDKYENNTEKIPEEFNLVASLDIMPDIMEVFAIEKHKKELRRHHTNGSKQMDLSDAMDVKNVLRCRIYRKNKKEENITEQSELETLKTLNKELRNEEARMREKRDKMQAAYLKLIRNGRIKLC